MTNEELLLALYTDMQEMKSDMREMKADMQTMKADMQTVKSDIVSMKSDIMNMKFDIENMKFDIESLKVQIESLNERVTKIELTLENETNRHIKILAENHGNLIDKLNQAVHVTDKNLIYEIQVNSLTDRVERLEKEFAEMKRNTA